jgi:hypothetical protein
MWFAFIRRTVLCLRILFRDPKMRIVGAELGVVEELLEVSHRPLVELLPKMCAPVFAPMLSSIVAVRSLPSLARSTISPKRSRLCVSGSSRFE